MKALIQVKFKYNSKHGISEWTDVVQEIFIVKCYEKDGKTWTPEFRIRGKNHSYKVSECVFID